LNLIKASPSEMNLILSVFTRLDIEEEVNLNKFTVGILDVFPHTLSVEDAALYLSSFQEHNMKYEHRFLDIFQRIFQCNGEEVYVYTSELLFNVEIEEVARISSNSILDYQNELVRITSWNDLQQLLTLTTRELLFSNFFFMSLKTVIIGNYDLSFPVYSLDKHSFTWISGQAGKNKLHVRRLAIERGY